MPSHDPVYKVTIIPRGRALGVTMQLPEQDRYSQDRDRLLNTIAVLFGGRIAEEVFMQQMTTGAANDFERVITSYSIHYTKLYDERRSMVMPEEERRNTAYHESGHAIVAKLLPKTDPVHKVTIIPRGRALGVTMQLPEQDRYSQDRDRLLNTIAVLFGGRIAEEA